MRRIAIAVGLVGMILVGGSPPPAADDGPAVPADFKVVARFGAGGHSRFGSWEDTITADGRVVQEEFFGLAPPRRRDRRIAPTRVRAIYEAFAAADWQGLGRRHNDRIFDSSTLVLTITADGATRDVSVYAPHFQKDDPEVRRFLGVWSQVLIQVVVPDPTQDPTPDRP